MALQGLALMLFGQTRWVPWDLVGTCFIIVSMLSCLTLVVEVILRGAAEGWGEKTQSLLVIGWLFLFLAYMSWCYGLCEVPGPAWVLVPCGVLVVGASFWWSGHLVPEGRRKAVRVAEGKGERPASFGSRWHNRPGALKTTLVLFFVAAVVVGVVAALGARHVKLWVLAGGIGWAMVMSFLCMAGCMLGGARVWWARAYRSLPLCRERLAVERMGPVAAVAVVIGAGLAGPFILGGLWGYFDTVLATVVVVPGAYMLILGGDPMRLSWREVGAALGVVVGQVVVLGVALSVDRDAAVFRVGEVALGLVVFGALAGAAFVRMRASILSNSGLYRPVKGRPAWLGVEEM